MRFVELHHELEKAVRKELLADRRAPPSKSQIRSTSTSK